MIATGKVRARLLGGPKDGWAYDVPRLDDGVPPRTIQLGGVDMAQAVAAFDRGESPDVAYTPDTTGEYRWSAHVAPLEGEAFDEYVWRDLRH